MSGHRSTMHDNGEEWWLSKHSVFSLLVSEGFTPLLKTSFLNHCWFSDFIVNRIWWEFSTFEHMCDPWCLTLLHLNERFRPLARSSRAVWGCRRLSGRPEGWRSRRRRLFCVEAMGSGSPSVSMASIKSPWPLVTSGSADRRSSCTGAGRQTAPTLWESLPRTDRDAPSI